MLANGPALSPETEDMEELPEIEHRGRPRSDGKSLERRSPSMKKKHTYRSADVEVIFPRRRGHSDYAANAATWDRNSNSIGLR
jgi:hypothetical protein